MQTFLIRVGIFCLRFGPTCRSKLVPIPQGIAPVAEKHGENRVEREPVVSQKHAETSPQQNRHVRWPRFSDHWPIKKNDCCRGILGCNRGRAFRSISFWDWSPIFVSVAQARSEGDKDRRRAVVGVVFWALPHLEGYQARTSLGLLTFAALIFLYYLI
jgi:hypothetical protein